MRPFAVLLLLAACELQPPPKQKPAPPPAAAQPVPAGSAAGSAGSAATVPANAGSAGSGSAGSGAGSAGSAEPTHEAAPPNANDANGANDVSNDCLQTGSHIAQVLIDNAKDPAVKAQFEQARTKIVRATAEACTKQAWTEDARRCYDGAKVEADVRACEKKFPPPGTQPQPPQRPHPKSG